MVASAWSAQGGDKHFVRSVDEDGAEKKPVERPCRIAEPGVVTGGRRAGTRQATNRETPAQWPNYCTDFRLESGQHSVDAPAGELSRSAADREDTAMQRFAGRIKVLILSLSVVAAEGNGQENSAAPAEQYQTLRKEY